MNQFTFRMYYWYKNLVFTLHILQSVNNKLHPKAVERHEIPISKVETQTRLMTAASDFFIALSIQAIPIRLKNMAKKDNMR